MSTSSPSASQTQTYFPANPTIPAYNTDAEWVAAYFEVHVMSHPSRRYAYLLWLMIAGVVLFLVILNRSNSSGGAIAARWFKWALRRRSWRGMRSSVLHRRAPTKHAPSFLPPNGQLLCLAALTFTTLALSFIGPDYIAPSQSTWIFYSNEDAAAQVAQAPQVFSSPYQQYQLQYTVAKAWWTSAGRTGIIAFALFPLCVLFALKATPFAVFALPFLTQMHFDKLAWLHRWVGRMIWFITVLHVAMWGVQLTNDVREGTNVEAMHYAWLHIQFVYGWVAFVFFTLLIIFSIMPLRDSHYEIFYALHVLLVPLTLIMSALHHPPLWAWCWTALFIWVAERLWRLVLWMRINGYLGGVATPVASVVFDQNADTPKDEKYEMSSMPHKSSTLPVPVLKSTSPPSLHPRSFSESSITKTPAAPPAPVYSPPPGYSHVELLSGGTVRITLVPPGPICWAPGQNFLLTIPALSNVTSHPFTCASICDQKSTDPSAHTLVFLVRAKSGWTKRLFELVVGLSARYESQPPGEKLPSDIPLPLHGVLLRTYVDGPFGSVERARWGSHSTAIIIAGGSGVSFGLAILEYICMCIAGRNGIHLGGRAVGRRGFMTKRIRFVWLVREFSHIQWGASIIRRCADLAPSALQVEIYVSQFNPPPSTDMGPPTPPPETQSPRAQSPEKETDLLVPPVPHFARQAKRQDRKHTRTGSDATSSPDSSDTERVFGDTGDAEANFGSHESYGLHLTHFDGENDIKLPGEDKLSRSVSKVGKLRRARTRKDRLARHGRRISREIRNVFRETSESAQGGIPSPETAISPDGGDTTAPIMEVPRIVEHSVYQHARDDSASSVAPPIHSRFSSLTEFGFMENKHRPSSSVSQNWDPETMASLRALIPGVDRYISVEQARLEVQDRELRDMNVVAEHARLGRPKLTNIVAEEVEKSSGAIIVACCGPTSLNALVRKSVAAHIDPSRILWGDMRGSISLVSEDFGY